MSELGGGSKIFLRFINASLGNKELFIYFFFSYCVQIAWKNVGGGDIPSVPGVVGPAMLHLHTNA